MFEANGKKKKFRQCVSKCTKELKKNKACRKQGVTGRECGRDGWTAAATKKKICFYWKVRKDYYYYLLFLKCEQVHHALRINRCSTFVYGVRAIREDHFGDIYILRPNFVTRRQNNLWTKYLEYFCFCLYFGLWSMMQEVPRSNWRMAPGGRKIEFY